jgi:exopolysaccharide biosynthesis WecB/TagA/CpsF family protein
MSMFLGIQFEVAAAPAVLARLRHQVDQPLPQAGVVVHANLNTVHACAHAPALRGVLQRPGTVVLFEGIGLKIARWLDAGQWWPDLNGTDLVPAFLQHCADRPLRLALVGGRPGVAQAAADAVAARFPHVVVAHVSDGYGGLADEPALLAALRQAQPDVLLVGLGTPLQEPKAAAWAAAGAAPLVWAVGGLFDLWAGARRRAPAPVLACRLEWLWRLLINPAAYWRRTFVQGPWLVWQLLHSGRASAGRAHAAGEPAQAHGKASTIA